MPVLFYAAAGALDLDFPEYVSLVKGKNYSSVSHYTGNPLLTRCCRLFIPVMQIMPPMRSLSPEKFVRKQMLWVVAAIRWWLGRLIGSGVAWWSWEGLRLVLDGLELTSVGNAGRLEARWYRPYPVQAWLVGESCGEML